MTELRDELRSEVSSAIAEQVGDAKRELGENVSNASKLRNAALASAQMASSSKREARSPPRPRSRHERSSAPSQAQSGRW